LGAQLAAMATMFLVMGVYHLIYKSRIQVNSIKKEKFAHVTHEI